MDQTVDRFRELLRQRTAAGRLQLLLKRQFDESQINRHPAGVTEGGRFAPAGGGGTSARPAKPAAKPTKPAAKPAPVSAFPKASGKFVNNFNSALDNVPPNAVKYLQANGVTFKATKSLSPSLGDQADNVMGVYMSAYKTIAIPEFVLENGKERPHPELAITVAHETAHALDSILGQQHGLDMMSDTPAFAKAHAEDVLEILKERPEIINKLAYYLDPNIGRGEAFAEIFAEATTMAGESVMSHWFPKTSAIVDNVVMTMWENE